MDDRHIPRQARKMLEALLARNPAVILTGARQAGKSSLARKVAASRPSVFYDLEKSEDRDVLSNHAVELRRHAGKLVVIDEVQHKPELFSELRVIIDELRTAGRTHGCFLLLGSVSGRLQRQSEGLTGRVAQMRMHPLNWLEVSDEVRLRQLWDRGGMPGSLLAKDDQSSLDWRRSYIETTVQKDALSSGGSRMTADHYIRLLALIAARQKDILNKARLASELGVRQETVNSMLANLEEMMLIARLPAYDSRIARSEIKRPKYYICDSGLFSVLIRRNPAALAGPAARLTRGAGWEGFAIENLRSVMPRHWRPFFFRTYSSGNEVDLLAERPDGRLWAIEIKAGQDATPDRKFLRCLQQLRPERSFLVHGGEFRHRRGGDVEVLSLLDMMNELLAQEPLVQPPPERTVVCPDTDFTAVMESLKGNGAQLNLHRDRFVGHFSRQAGRLLATNLEPHDRDARNEWIEIRNQLLKWLDLESALKPRGEDAADWRHRLIEALETLLAAAHAAGRQARKGYDFNGTFGKMCCHDMFLHAVAVLMRNRCFSSARELMGRKYYLHGQMLASICFWSGPPGDANAGKAADGRMQPEPDRTVGDFVATRPAETINSLIEVELVLLLHGMLDEDERPPPADWKFVWLPCLLQAARSTPELPLFVRAENEEGVRNILACLGLPPKPASMERIREAAGIQLNSNLGQSIESWDTGRIAHCLRLDRWHALGSIPEAGTP